MAPLLFERPHWLHREFPGSQGQLPGIKSKATSTASDVVVGPGRQAREHSAVQPHPARPQPSGLSSLPSAQTGPEPQLHSRILADRDVLAVTPEALTVLGARAGASCALRCPDSGSAKGPPQHVTAGILFSPGAHRLHPKVLQGRVTAMTPSDGWAGRPDTEWGRVDSM